VFESRLQTQLERQGIEHDTGLAEWTTLQGELQSQVKQMMADKLELGERVRGLQGQLEESITSSKCLQAEYAKNHQMVRLIIIDNITLVFPQDIANISELQSDIEATRTENIALKTQVNDLSIAKVCCSY